MTQSMAFRIERAFLSLGGSAGIMERSHCILSYTRALLQAMRLPLPHHLRPFLVYRLLEEL